jgi:hypothetical protein
MHMMNLRIKHLAEQANDYANHLDKIGVDDGWQNIFNQKFAELIVAECAEVILKTFVVHNEIDAMHRIRDNVKQHFGVTE